MADQAKAQIHAEVEVDNDTEASTEGEHTRQWMELVHPEHATAFQLAALNNLARLAERLDEVMRIVEAHMQSQSKVRLIASVPEGFAHADFSGLKGTHARQNSWSGVDGREIWKSCQ